VNNNTSNEQVLALLQQLAAQNAALLQQVAELQAKTDLLEHKLDLIAEEAGLI
jgi:cell division protein FtsB